jgi:hypothetical protein
MSETTHNRDEQERRSEAASDCERSEQEICDAARVIADAITVAARTSGDDPVAWVTGNAYMPPLRSFGSAEAIWQDRDDDAWEMPTELLYYNISPPKEWMASPNNANTM